MAAITAPKQTWTRMVRYVDHPVLAGEWPAPVESVKPSAARWPRTETCTCGEPVLRARHNRAGRPFTLDPIPVLPLGKCGPCGGLGKITFWGASVGGPAAIEPGDLVGKQRPIKGEPCPACGATGQRGEQLTSDHVLVTTDGIGRPNDGESRRKWEAAHRRHRCST